MLTQRFYRVVLFVIIIGLFALLPMLDLTVVEGSAQQVKAAASTQFDSLLPLISAKYAPAQSIFGVEMFEINDAAGQKQMVEAGNSWVRRNALYWVNAEAFEGEYKWWFQPRLSREIINASNHGFEMILVVRKAPDWALETPGEDFGRIRADKIEAFANFMYEAVKWYGQPPYNVKYWQIWNEPEVVPGGQQAGNINGCWGDPNEPYYGGAYYADVLKQVYPKIKAADPEAKVVVGGILMDCNNSPDCPNYLEGILNHDDANDGANYFDVLGFNAYDYYFDALGKYGNPNWYSKWDTSSTYSGPVVRAKLTYIRDLFTKYNVHGKTLINTEGALLCGNTGLEPTCLTGEYELTKAYYLAQLFSTSLAEGLEANIWYSLTGWRGSGLFDAFMNPLPAYYAFNIANTELKDATFARHITEFAGLQGYEFNRQGQLIWILWAQTASGSTITLPGTPSKIIDALGIPESISGTNLNVTVKPLWIEW